ncbi:transposase domain-containing protein [Streptomyces sp. NPDC002133]|uniref:transposase domain-containing protein n=1 Tax=Streptomyces sp. NPDC002133 TaxID=3154409 RepID=UPI00332E99C8
MWPDDADSDPHDSPRGVRSGASWRPDPLRPLRACRRCPGPAGPRGRTRTVPARVAVYFVLAPLFIDASYGRVWNTLTGALRQAGRLVAAPTGRGGQPARAKFGRARTARRSSALGTWAALHPPVVMNCSPMYFVLAPLFIDASYGRVWNTLTGALRQAGRLVAAPTGRGGQPARAKFGRARTARRSSALGTWAALHPPVVMNCSPMYCVQAKGMPRSVPRGPRSR